jgi:hypothetical protein
MEQSISWEDSRSCPFIQEISLTKAHYSIYKKPPIGPYSVPNESSANPPILIKIHFIIILQRYVVWYAESIVK